MARRKQSFRQRLSTARVRRLVVEQFEPRLLLANMAPSGKDGTDTTFEDTPYVFAATDFGFSDPNDTPANSFAAVKVATLPVAGRLTDNNVPVVAGQFIFFADISAGLLKFTPAADDNGFPYGRFTFQVQDDGGTANGGVDLDQTPNTITINVWSVNDPPLGMGHFVVVDPPGTGSGVLPINVYEDSYYNFSVSDFGFIDPDDNPPNNFRDLKITTLPTAGTLLVGSTPATAGMFVPANNIQGGQLRYVPPPNANGPLLASFTFQVQDDGGTTFGGIDLQVTPGTLAFNVVSVNDPPSGTDKTVGTTEDHPYTFSAGDFGFSDPNDSPSNVFWGARISALPAVGTLLDNNVSVSVGQIVLKAELDGGVLTFVPAPNANGAPYSQFTFQVKDDGGTANGGLDLDPTPNTMTINVASVNDPPFGTDSTRLLLENTTYTLSPSDWGFFDPNDSPPNRLVAVFIDSVPPLGALRFNGVSVTAGFIVTAASLAAGQLTYTPPANVTGTTSFSFQVKDDGGTANFGLDTNPAPKTLTLRIIQTEPIITGTSGVVSALEDAPYSFSASNFGFVSTANPPTNLKAVKITTLPAVGTLTDNGAALTPGVFVPVQDINAGNFRFAAPANANGMPFASFTFQVQDDGDPSDGFIHIDPTPKTLAINVTPVNDPPSGTNNTVTMPEDMAHVFSVADFGFSDPNDNPPNSFSAVRIATLPALGTLTDNGVVISVGQSVTVADIAAGNLRYVPPPNASAHPLAAFTFQVQDNGGAANGGVDLDPLSKTMTINVDFPQDIVITRDDSYTPLEDTALMVSAPGVLANDSNNPGPAPSATLAAVLVAGPAHGSLTLNSDGSFTYLPAANFNGHDSFTYKAVGFFEGNVATVTLNVTSVNDPPSGIDLTVALPLYATYVFPISDFPLNDANDNPSNALYAVTIATLPAAGTLTDNGVPVIVGQFIPVADLAGGLLRYTPPVNLVLYDSFTFQVQDNGGTANGGIDLDPTPNTITLGPIGPPPPEGFDATVTTLEDQPYVFSYFDIFGPIRDPIPNQPFYPLIAVKITTLPAVGTLLDNGVPVAAGQFISVDDFLPVGKATAGAVTFVPAPNANGAPLTTFTFQVQDSGGTANGRLDLDPTPNTITINTTPVNDAPTFVKGPDLNVTDESGEVTIAGWATAISAGPPNESSQHVHFVMVGIGSLSLFASSPSIDASGNVNFTPARNVQGTARITIELKDDGGTANGGVDTSQPQTFQINIAKAHPLHNAVNPNDVNGDGKISPSDPLLVINFINGFGSQPVNPTAVGPPYYDVDGDNFIAPHDALAIINFINARSMNGEGETAANVPADLLMLVALDVASQPRRRL